MLKEFKHLIFAVERMLISFCYNDCLKTGHLTSEMYLYVKMRGIDELSFVGV